MSHWLREKQRESRSPSIPSQTLSYDFPKLCSMRDVLCMSPQICLACS